VGDPKLCGGVLISDEWVLTSTMCTSENGYTVFGYAGEWTINTSVVHYHAKVPVMMLKLESPVPQGSCSKAVQLPSADLADGANCWATGWADPDDARPWIRYQVEVTENSHCDDKFSQLNQVDTICSAGNASGDNVADICPGGVLEGGEGGFPLVCKYENGPWVLHGVGLVRFGAACLGEPQGKFPEAFSRVFVRFPLLNETVPDWIRDTVGVAEEASPLEFGW